MKFTHSVSASAGRLLLLIFIFVSGLAGIIGSGSSGDSGVQKEPRTVAVAVADESVRTGTQVVLDGRLSDFASASDSGQLGITWRFVSYPDGSQASFVDSGNRTSHRLRPTFVPDVDGRYKFILETRASGDIFDPEDTSQVVVIASPGNAAPVARAGADRWVAIGDTVQLHGSGSDPDGDSISYAWSGDDVALLSDPAVADPSFVASQAQWYSFMLTTNDGQLDSARDLVTIFALDEAEARPNAVAGVDRIVTPGSSVQLDGSASHDPYGKTLTYLWKVLSAPEDVTLSDADMAQASFQPASEGDYLLALRVNNGTRINRHAHLFDNMADDRLVVSVMANQPPVADGGSDQTVTTANAVTLDGSASSDPEGATLSYQWSVFHHPTGSTAQPIPTDGQTTQFTPDLDGYYLLQLVVNDGTQDSAPAIIRVQASGGGTATPLTVITPLPWTPTGFEVATWVQMAVNGSNDLRLISSDDIATADYETILEATWTALGQASFNTYGTAWQLVSAPSNPVSDTSTAAFVLRRVSDGRYFKLVMDFTALGTAVVQVDSLQGWDCGLSALNCP